jgi:hypothetical protein
MKASPMVLMTVPRLRTIWLRMISLWMFSFFTMAASFAPICLE